MQVGVCVEGGVRGRCQLHFGRGGVMSKQILCSLVGYGFTYVVFVKGYFALKSNSQD